MNTIRFSHFYQKMPRDYQYSKLLQVIPVKLEDMSPEFLLYDTTYIDGGEEKQYPLPTKGEYLLLLLQAGSGHGRLWTTLRSRYGGKRDKLEYYNRLAGKILECVVS
jgi:hypothetical protein